MEPIAMNDCSFTELGEPNYEGYPCCVAVQAPDSCLPQNRIRPVLGDTNTSQIRMFCSWLQLSLTHQTLQETNIAK